MVTRGLQWIGHLLTRDEYEPVQMAAFYRVREEERNTYKELNFEGIILVFVCRSVQNACVGFLNYQKCFLLAGLDPY